MVRMFLACRWGVDHGFAQRRRRIARRVAACGGGSPAAPGAGSDAAIDAPVDAAIDARQICFPCTEPVLKAPMWSASGCSARALRYPRMPDASVGADDEASASTGINGNQFGGGATESGAVYVFVRSSSADPWYSRRTSRHRTRTGWTGSGLTSHSRQTARRWPSVRTTSQQRHPASMAIRPIHSAGSAGAVYVFTRAGTTWTQQATEGLDTDSQDLFGFAIALDSDGSTLAGRCVSGGERFGGIGADQSDNTAPVAGAVYVSRAPA